MPRTRRGRPGDSEQLRRGRGQRGKSQANLLLIERAKVILEEIQPAGVRAVCYRLFVRGWLPSMAKNCMDKVSKQLVYAREEGIIPWEWIVDETRAVERVPVWGHAAEYIADLERDYRRDAWLHQPYRVEVWSEKATVSGTIAPVLDAYGVSYRYMHGYSSATALHETAEESEAETRVFVVLYVGDWDPSGMHMSEVDVRNRLERYGGDVVVVRIALTAADIADPELPSFAVETKRKDARFRWFVANYGQQCWELDALSPVVLRQRVETEICRYIDWPVWHRSDLAEAAEKATIREIMGEWNRRLSRG